MSRITGSIEFTNELTGRVVTRRANFTVPESTAWVDIVDEAVERYQPKSESKQYGWMMTDERLEENSP